MKNFFTLFLLMVIIWKTYPQRTWYWYNPVGDSYHIKDIFFNSKNDGWASGEGGKLLHFDGQKWSMAERLTWNDLNGICFTDPGHGWAVGGGGVILRYDDNDWTMTNSGNTKRLHSVFFNNENDGWAVGEARRHYTNGQWITVDTVGYNGVSEVFFTGEDNGWSGGSDKMYRYDSAGWHWSPLPFSDYYSVNSIFFLDSVHGWLGGYYSDFTKMIMEYNGTGWTLSDKHPYIISNDLYFDSPEHGWSCGDISMFASTTKTIWEYNGTNWLGSYSSHNIANTIGASDPGEIYVGTEYGHILYHDSLGWHLSNSLSEGGTILTFPDTSHGWAVGEGREILRYEHGVWGIDTSFSGVAFSQIHFADTSHGIAVGIPGDSLYNTAVYLFKNGEWHFIDTIHATILTVASLSNGEAWFGGYCGTGACIFHLSNDTITRTVFTDLFGINCISFPAPDEGWAGGWIHYLTQSKILRYQSGQWTTETELPSSQYLNSISFANPNSGMAAGGDFNHGHGIIWIYDGNAWYQDPYSGAGLTAIQFPDPQHAYAVAGRSVLTLNNGQWESESINLNQDLVSVNFPSPDVGWVAGSNGAILSSRSPYPVGNGENPGPEEIIRLSLFPNPVSDLLTIEFISPIIVSARFRIEIRNLPGQLVYTNETRNNSDRIELNTTGFEPGIYFVALVRNGQTLKCEKVLVN